jgi:hypothetical protein
MNGKVQIIEAIEIAHHTGTVWSASFPYPTASFLEDMSCGVSERASGRNLSWFAYGMRREMKGGKPVLTIRFDDRGSPPTPPGSDVKTVSAVLGTPMA